MAAGLGFKTFTTGEVLTAADTNGYLMQGVLVFASAAARDAAITSPQEGQCCYLKDTDAVLTYSGAAWVGFDDSNAIQNAIVDAKGDLIAASAADTPARLAVGTDGQTLVADSTASTGLKWATAAAGGKVLQVITATISTGVSSSSTTLVDSGLTATITPSLATSKVLVMTSQQYYKTNGNAGNAVKSALFRGATQIANIAKNMLVTDTAIYNVGCLAYNYLDSPSTTSATTYKIQFANESATSAVGVSLAGNELQTIILMEIGA